MEKKHKWRKRGESVRGDGLVDGRLFERGVCKRGGSVKENTVLEGEFKRGELVREESA